MTAALAIKQPKLLVPDFTPEHVLTIDFETYWAQDYSLTALGTSDYVMDPRFEIIGVGVGDGETRTWMERAEFESWAREVPWHLTAVKAHHAHFDGLILSHHLGIHPAFFFCTLSMSRTFGLQDRGLDDLGVHFKVGRKGSGVYDAKEKRRRDFTPEQWAAYGQYCLNDLALTDDIFDAMSTAEEGYPESELWVINQHVKMFTEPRIFLDTPLLVEFLKDERVRKKALLDRVAKDRKIITSDKLFINELYLAGLDVIPMKPSPKRKVKREVTVTENVNGLDVKVKKMVDTDEPLMIPAFSKNDPGMQELVEHEIEMVRWLAETRLAIKSTINETRTERFLKSAGVQVLPDGRAHQFAAPRPVCVYLNYYGAHTGRASGSDKRNWQNLERTNKKNPKKGVLRKSALAPAGRKFAAADSGAIEARVNAWLAGHETLIEGFAQNRDVYSEFMSEVLGRHVDRKKNPEDEIPGFIGKICLGPETRVLTPRGWVRIVDVRQTDRVWDGVEWVQHEGLLDQGMKEVIEGYGVVATPDHEMLTEHGWREWHEVLTSRSLFQSALASASSPYFDGNVPRRSADATPATTQSYDAVAAGKEWSGERISHSDARHDATPARRSAPVPSGGGSTRPSSRMMKFALGFSIAALRSSVAATIRRIQTFSTTAVEAFESVVSGEMIPSPSFAMSSGCAAGTSLNLTSIASTTTEGTSQAMFVLRLASRTPATSAVSPTSNAASPSSKQKSRVYDLLNAGPRHRFTILTSEGPLIASNCILGLGYQMGWPKLAENFLKGAMNGPPVKFGWDMAEQLSVDVSKFISDDWKMEKVEKMITRVTKEELIVHCAVTEAIVKKWRNLNQPIVRLWDTMEKVIEAMCEDDADYTFGPNECLRVVRHAIVLPNGMRLRYPGLRFVDGYSYLGQYGKMRHSIYGGKLTENVVQALARIIVTDQMLHIKAITGEDPALFTHDDLAYLPTDDRASWFSMVLQQTMKTTPDWAEGLPLSVEGGVDQSYGKCK